MISIAAAAHQGWSANIFTFSSDMFPRRAVGSVVGIGGMAGAVGGMLIALITGYILQWTGSYVPVFIMAASAYLVALGIIQLLVPRIRPGEARLDVRRRTAAPDHPIRHEDRRRPGHRLLAGPQLRHAEGHDRGRRVRASGDATLNGRELAVAAYLTEHVDPVPDRPRRAADRGHLAVPLQGRVLAARPGDDGRDRRGRHGAVGHQGQVARRARLPAARRRARATPSWCTATRTARHRAHRAGGGATLRGRATTRSARKAASRVWRARTASRRERCRTSPPNAGCRPEPRGAARRTSPSCRRCSSACARSSVDDVHLLHDVHHRLTPIEAARLGKDRSSRITCSGWRIPSRPRRRKAFG